MKPDPRSSPSSRGGAWPHPVLSALLAVVWLLLQQSIALPQLIAAAAFAFFVPRLVRGFLLPLQPRRPWRVGLRAAGLALRLVAVVLLDIVVSNLTVARIVLWPRSQPQPAWVRVPLELDDEIAITLLAAIITTTPGTVSCLVDETRREILVHALDCAAPAALVAQIKARYERPLKEIFG